MRLDFVIIEACGKQNFLPGRVEIVYSIARRLERYIVPLLNGLIPLHTTRRRVLAKIIGKLCIETEFFLPSSDGGTPLSGSKKVFNEVLRGGLPDLIGESSKLEPIAISRVASINGKRMVDVVFRALVALDRENPRALRFGDKSLLVEYMQLLLVSRMTGTFDNETEVELLKFQKKSEIPESGVCDAKTWEALIANDMRGLLT